METQSIYEPMVTEKYLNSGEQHVAELEGLLSKESGNIIVKPEILNGTPYSLNIKLSKPDRKSPFYMLCYLRGENSDNPYAFFTLQSDLVPKDGKIEVYGSYENSTHKGYEQQGTIIRNFSGITAPYEDAIFQALANIKGITTQRIVVTSQKPESRIVGNFLKRGYANKGYHEVNKEEKLILVKDFSPTPPATT